MAVSATFTSYYGLNYFDHTGIVSSRMIKLGFHANAVFNTV